MRASDNKFTGWQKILGWNCYLENGKIVQVLDEDYNRHFLWEPVDGGYNAIPRCSVSRFYQGLKRGTVIIS